MNARLLINNLPLSLGKIKPAELCNALKPVGPIYLHGRGQIPWVRIEREGSIPMGHCAGERCIVKSSLLLEKIQLSLNAPHSTLSLIWRKMAVWGQIRERRKNQGTEGKSVGIKLQSTEALRKHLYFWAFVSPAPLVKERTAYLACLRWIRDPGTLSIWEKSTAKSYYLRQNKKHPGKIAIWVFLVAQW